MNDYDVGLLAIANSFDGCLQKFLWWNSPSEPMCTYRYVRSFLCASSCHQTPQPQTAKALSKGPHIDDILTSVNCCYSSEVSCWIFFNEPNSAIHRTALQLQFSSNPPSELRDDRIIVDLEASAPNKTRELKWRTITDEFLFDVPDKNASLIINKRS